MNENIVHIKEQQNFYEVMEKLKCSRCGKIMDYEIDTATKEVCFSCPEYLENGDENHDSYYRRYRIIE